MRQRLWNAKNVERYLLHQIEPARAIAAFEPAAARTAPSAQEFDALLVTLDEKLQAAMNMTAEYEGKLRPSIQSALARH
ncbi:hypothetical protein IVB41_15965 [Bradyrhizobium sp. 44]|uniref:hypothetical protein n=1 Tax=Bradyrhizobium sp. 44 TaxID=2782675 RepID=UPI001FF95DCE|nr:hypothetical protein [Bradyrhizobium sp. 44]MCK1285417.1 hypothetical protein [Bradyrhizobium sp. 44]